MTLWEIFQTHEGRLTDKWASYFPIYERHFSRFVGTSVRVLEIGVSHGGSLQLWKKYFGLKAEIIGLDIDARCKAYEEEQITIHIADQALPPPILGPLDIVIDDGSHRPEDQAASFTHLFPTLRAGGIYLVEDCHQHYPALWPDPALVYRYPWVIVAEVPHRMIKGKPSRPLNAAELAAYGDL